MDRIDANPGNYGIDTLGPAESEKVTNLVEVGVTKPQLFTAVSFMMKTVWSLFMRILIIMRI